jgi:hypothetical protein
VHFIILEDLIRETIEVIDQNDCLQEGDTYPPMYHSAAEFVFKRNEIGPAQIGRLDTEKLSYQLATPVADSWLQFNKWGLIEFIGQAAKKCMGPRYQQLLDTRMAKLASPEAAFAE